MKTNKALPSIAVTLLWGDDWEGAFFEDQRRADKEDVAWRGGMLDIAKITTLEELDDIAWEKYLEDKSWLKFIKYPVSQRDLDRVCALSRESDTVILRNSMGDLYYYERKQSEMKGL